MSTANKNNKLVDSLSPYLLQHADNPVNWYPWGDEAIQLARETDKPIFLSIGYSACHWCHVMAHECFENEEIAEQMNEHFVNIKVDREERPDLDEIYMAATQLFSGSGGWPMSVFLNHDLTPFFAGTYFPPVSKFGRISFPALLGRLSGLWTDDRTALLEQGKEIVNAIQRISELQKSDDEVDEIVIEKAVEQLKRRFDKFKGGFGQAPKFPDPQGILLLLRHHHKNVDTEALEMIEKTLTEMALGGIYDHLGGGFARYSVDDDWLVPHFEKMLYDNAMLPRAYLAGSMVTNNIFYQEVAIDIIEFILKEMRDENGGFYSALDADSEGVEGKFYVWSLKEIQEILGKENAKLFAEVYDVTKSGNWEEGNILNLSKPLYEWEKEKPGIRVKLSEMRKKLYEVRAKRIPPGLDDKVLTEWNGLMITTCALVGAVVDRNDFVEAAIAAAEFIYQKMKTNEGTLLRVYRKGKAHTLGYHADYAAYSEACLALYQATFEPIWLSRAEEIVQKMNELFWDEKEGAYFYTTADAKDMISRTKHPHDNPYPSGNTMAVSALHQLARLTEKKGYQEKIEKTFQAFQGNLEKQSFGFIGMLGQMQEWFAPKLDITFVGPLEEKTLIQEARRQFVPGKLLIGSNPADAKYKELPIPQLTGRTSENGKLTAYVCVNQTCSLPVVELTDFQKLLTKKHESATPKKKAGYELIISADAKNKLKELLDELDPAVSLKLHLNPKNQVELTATTEANSNTSNTKDGLRIILDTNLTSKTTQLALDYNEGEFHLKN